MKRGRQIFLFCILLLFLAALWLYWWRPVKVDMAAYVPADTLVYLEANDLPDIISGMAQTEAWRTLAPAAGLELNTERISWLSRLAARTGIGPAEAVVLSRAQLAVAVLSIEAADGGDSTLKIRPRIAVIVETHTGERRTQAAVEKLVGSFARRAYGEPVIRQEESEGAKLTVWTAPGGERRIVAAILGSVAVIGNDAEAVRACLQVRRSQRPSLAGNPQLEEIRGRVHRDEAAAFGYVSPAGTARILEVSTALYAGLISDNPQVQSLAASLFLPLAKKLLGGVGWSTRFSGGRVEDTYFLSLQNGMAAQLREPLSSFSNTNNSATNLLPAGIYSLSRYNSRDPALAWRGLHLSLSSQADPMAAILISRYMDEILKPYGIEEPESFLRAIGQEIVTARLDDAGASTVTIVGVRDEKALRDFIARRLGPKPRSEHIGDAEILISRDETAGAASFVDGQLLMGSAANVRRCLQARAEQRLLSSDETFRRAASLTATSDPANAVTFTDDERAARSFLLAVMAQRSSRAGSINYGGIEKALASLPYAVSETRLVEGGFERKTRSSFGQFGTLAAQFAVER
jgi:hypothetical protein